MRTTHLLAATFVGLFALTSSATAAPITITQTLAALAGQLSVNGSPQTVAGDWIFTIQVDTSTLDSNLTAAGGTFLASSITLTNTGLGVTNIAVTSPLYYHEHVGGGLVQTGISDSLINNGVGLRAISAGQIGDPNVIEPALLNFTGTAQFFSFGAGAPLTLANGTTISGSVIEATAGTQAAELTDVAVPEPTSMLLLGTGLVGVALRRRMKRS